jgi:hypothetical protein
MASEIKANKISPATGTDFTLGDSGDTFTVPSGTTLDIASGATLDTTGATVSGLTTGKVLQVVQTYKTDTASTTSTSFVDVSGFSANITPASTSNKILVLVTIGGQGQSGVSQAYFRIDRNGSVVGVADAAGSRRQISGASIYPADNNTMSSTAFNYLDSPSTTSSLTYKIQFSADGGTVYVNRSHGDGDLTVRGRGTSSITLMEIGA